MGRERSALQKVGSNERLLHLRPAGERGSEAGYQSEHPFHIRLRRLGNPLVANPNDPFGYEAQWGYYTDNETGLLLLTHRYYDPTQGRFLTRDPIGYEGGVDLYGYAGNNTVGGLDWSGDITFSAGVGGVFMYGLPEWAVLPIASGIGGAFWDDGSIFLSIPHWNDVIHPGSWRVGVTGARGSGGVLGSGLGASGGLSLGISSENPPLGYSHDKNIVIGGFCDNGSIQFNKDKNGWTTGAGGLGRWGRGIGRGLYMGSESDSTWTWSLGQVWNAFIYASKNAYIDYHF